jgi:hypothetical protein
VDHCYPQRRSSFCCSHIAAERRTGDIRRRLRRCVACVDVSDWRGVACGEGDGVWEGRVVLLLLLLIAGALRR